MYLSEYESKRMLRKYDIPITKEYICKNKRQALIIAVRLFEYPVVMKVSSKDIIHKKKSNGVLLNIKSNDELLEAYDSICKSTGNTDVLIQEQLNIKKEYFIGYKIDNIFGKILLFGIGGSDVESKSDIAIRSIPMEQSEIYNMLDKYVSDVNVKEEFINVIHKLCELIDENPQIIELDINPIALTDDNELIVVDSVINIIR